MTNLIVELAKYILIILICGPVGFLHTGRTGKEKTP